MELDLAEMDVTAAEKDDNNVVVHIIDDGVGIKTKAEQQIEFQGEEND